MRGTEVLAGGINVYIGYKRKRDGVPVAGSGITTAIPVRIDTIDIL